MLIIREFIAYIHNSIHKTKKINKATYVVWSKAAAYLDIRQLNRFTVIQTPELNSTSS